MVLTCKSTRGVTVAQNSPCSVFTITLDKFANSNELIMCTENIPHVMT